MSLLNTLFTKPTIFARAFAPARKQYWIGLLLTLNNIRDSGAISVTERGRGGSRGRVQGVRTPPSPWDDLRFSNTTGILQKKKTMWFIGVEVEQETSAPLLKKILDPLLRGCTASISKAESHISDKSVHTIQDSFLFRHEKLSATTTTTTTVSREYVKKAIALDLIPAAKQQLCKCSQDFLLFLCCRCTT